MVLITIFTVGYGDMSAHTILGRAISLFMAFTCLLIIASLINIVQHSLHLNDDEQKVIRFLQENKSIKIYKEQAILCIKQFLTIYARKYRSIHKKIDYS